MRRIAWVATSLAMASWLAGCQPAEPESGDPSPGPAVQTDVSESGGQTTAPAGDETPPDPGAEGSKPSGQEADSADSAEAADQSTATGALQAVGKAVMKSVTGAEGKPDDAPPFMR